MNLAWSAEAEHRLRQRILLAHAGLWSCIGGTLLLALLGLMFSRSFANALILSAFGVILLAAAAFAGGRLMALVCDLGWEESVQRGARVTGSGMLANKPRDTSRLTRWVRQTDACNAPGIPPAWGFVCICHRAHAFADMKYVTNVPQPDDPESEGEVSPVDPEGGRFVLICECGVGHYMLKPLSASDIVQRAVRKAK